MVMVYWFLILCAALPAGTEAHNRSIRDEGRDLSEVVVFITNRHLSKFTSTLVIVERGLKPRNSGVNTLLLDHILPDLQGEIAVQLCIRIYGIPPRKYYIFIVDSFAAFREILLEFPTTVYERRFYFLIILSKYTPNFHNVMEKIFKLCYKFDVINVNVILDHPKLGVCMFTYMLFSEGECRVVRPQLYFRFNRGFEYLDNVFPEKLSNFYGCPMKVIGRLTPPMLIFKGDTSHPRPVGRWENLSGLEGKLLNLIAESLNFTIDFLPFSMDREGCITELLGGKADVAIGGFSGSDPDRWILSPSVLYHHSPYVFVLRGGHLRGSLGRLATPFNYTVWILLTCLLIAGTIIIQVLRFMKPSVRRFVFGERNDTPLANFIAVFLGYPISRTPRTNFARYILLLWLLLTLVIRNAYQGSLYDAFRMYKFLRIPTGYDDLMAWNYVILVPPNVARLDIFPQNNSTVVMRGDYSKRFKILESTREKYATVALRDAFIYYMGRIYNSRRCDLIIINEVVYMYHTVMLFPKNSIYVAAFNRKLQAFAYSGITSCLDTAFTAEPAMFWKYKQKPPKRVLSNDRLMAMYKIYGVMTIVAIIVFGLELVSVYSERIHRTIGRIN